MQAAAIEFDAGVMLERIGVAPGWRCLDLGCGSGGMLELLSVRAGPTGRVIALDADAVLLAHARMHARDRGLGNLEFVQGDAYRTSCRAEVSTSCMCASSPAPQAGRRI